MTLDYSLKLLWKYCNYYHPPEIKISISYQNYGHLVRTFWSLFRQSPNFMILGTIFIYLFLIYFCIISIFLRGSGVPTVK